MNRLVLSVLFLLALCAAVPCVADTVNGALTEERVITLPQDAGKWYISVVGNANDTRYNEIMGWFATNPRLMKRKEQVHFCPVTTGTAIYKDRYATNIKGLPTVRMQKPTGVVVYEAAGKALPMTAAALNAALSNTVSIAEGIRPVLPWRKDMESRCPGPCPTPSPQPDSDPVPDQQPSDNGGTPEIEPPAESSVQWVWLPLLCLGGLLIGVLSGYGKQLYRKLHPAVK